MQFGSGRRCNFTTERREVDFVRNLKGAYGKFAGQEGCTGTPEGLARWGPRTCLRSSAKGATGWVLSQRHVTGKGTGLLAENTQA